MVAGAFGPQLAQAVDATILTHQAFVAGSGREAEAAAVLIRDAAVAGRLILVFGNGGSATDAQHFAAELVVRFVRARRAVAALALTSDGAVMTAAANDLGVEAMFARQIEALGRPGDVAVAISTSGRSPNVLEALKVAKARGLSTIALTGRDGGEAGRLADVHVNVPSDVTARIQEVHGTWIHAVCAWVEEDL
ncbi:MAG: SIS domain-containing protein [Acidobacteria bacterium]|jgi:phosphoheptose isomerase|nr:SIS domain-containing protein [Acidobacteriota bacterium]